MTPDGDKTKAELLKELETLSHRISNLEQTRKNAEGELKQYQFIVESAHDAIFFKDLESRYIVANNKTLEAFGLPREKVIGKNDYDVMPNKEEAKKNIDDDQLVFKTGKVTEITKQMTDASGGKRWFHGIKVPQFDDKGEIVGLVGIARDITGRKQAEQALRESEEKWRSLAENAPCVILTVKPDGTILFLNRTVPPYTPENAVGTSVYDYVPPEYHQTMRDALEQVVRTGEPYSYELAGCGPDGRTSWYRSCLGPIKQDGRVVALTLVATDITEQRQAEIDLRQSEHKYRTLLENLPQKIFLKDISSVYLSCNENLAKDFKLKADQIVGKTDYDLMPKELAEKYRADDKRIIESGQAQNIEEKYIQDGKESIIHTVKTPVRDEQGNIIGILGIFWDITQQKQAEQELQVRTAILQNIISNIPYSVFWKDKNSVYLGCNDNFAKLAGLEKTEDIVGKTDYDLPWKKEESDFYRKIDKEVVSYGTPVLNIEEPVHSRNGKVATILTSKVPLRNADGEITGILGIFTDITERKQAEEKLRESEGKYRTLYESSKDGIASSDIQGNFTEANQAYLNMLGYSSEELANLTYRQVTPKKWHKLEADFVKNQVLKRGYSDEYEKEYIKKDGTVFPVSMRVWLVKDTEGEPIGMWAYIRDISEYKKAEQALQESQGRQKAILDNIPDIAWLKDKNGRYIAANEALCKAFGIKLEDIIGKTDFDISPQDLAKKYRADDREVMKSGKHKRVEELWGKKEGDPPMADRKPVPSQVEAAGPQRIWVETIKTPIYDDNGRVIGTSGIARDITERKKAEEEIRQYHEKMARAERLASIGTLSATMAHELNQPLTVINLSIENTLAALENMACPPALGGFKEALKDALSGVARATSIINGFRNYARKSAKKFAKEVNLKAVAEKTVMLLGESARRARVILSLKDMDKLPTVYLVEEDLDQLFFALAENAIQAADGEKERRLVISGAVKNQQIELQFSDDCGGIAPEILDKIFEPFFTTKPADKRTGLGLCIVEHIVSQTGGRVRVESKLGKGTTFYVTLPININIK